MSIRIIHLSTTETALTQKKKIQRIITIQPYQTVENKSQNYNH